MSTIPSGQKFHTVASNINTVERGSALSNAGREIYTMQDIIDTVGGGGIQPSQTPLDWTNDEANFLVKCDDGLYRNANPSEWWHLMMQSGLFSTTPNVVSDNFVTINISTNGAWGNIQGWSTIPYYKLTSSFGTETFGEAIRMMNFGNAIVTLKSSANSNFIEVDNYYMQSWVTNNISPVNQYVLVAPNLIGIHSLTLDSALYKIDAPNLKYIGTIQAQDSSNELIIPSVEYSSYVQLFNHIADIDISGLRYVSSIDIYNQQQTFFDLSNLEVANSVLFGYNFLYEIDLNNLVYVQNLQIADNNNLETIHLQNLRVYLGDFVDLRGNNLTQSCVDNILVTFALMDGLSAQYPQVFENSNIQLNGGTNQPPSAVGLNAIAILNSRGCSVSTN